MVHILYNPLAANGRGNVNAEEIAARFPGRETTLESVVGMDFVAYFEKLTADDCVVLCGGDGTLNRFANETADVTYPCPLYLYRAGSGNDFMQDVVGAEEKMVQINRYLENLPTITVKGKTYRYINGIGYGIDGMVCEIADEMKARGETDISYSGLSIKLLIHGYHCPNARVTVDGKTHEFKRVWLASAMNGRYYGGGMKIAPDQDRLSGKLSVSILYGSGRLKTLIVFPSIFKGEHIKHKEMSAIMTGNTITVEFDRPCALQIDGEVVSDVTSYTASIGCKKPAEV